MVLPPNLAPLAMSEKALNAGIKSSGAPTWMKVPLLRSKWRYWASGISLLEMVQPIRLRERL